MYLTSFCRVLEEIENVLEVNKNEEDDSAKGKMNIADFRERGDRAYNTFMVSCGAEDGLHLRADQSTPSTNFKISYSNLFGSRSFVKRISEVKPLCDLAS